MNFKSIYILLLTSLALFTCKKEEDTCKQTKAFIGGEIINPNSDHLLLIKSREVIDTITLDSNNRFAYELTDFTPGLYNFYDGHETQFILIQPKDSLLFRINTIEFDESLVYTGIGAKENNYLIDLFLETEREEDEKKILTISQLDPEPFEEKLKVIRDEKLAKLKKFKAKHKTTKLFNAIAEANINYNYYSRKEFYPFANYRKSELDIFNSLPDDFYDYRKTVDYNNEILEDYPPYTNFLKFHVTNIAFQTHMEHSDEKEYNEYSVDYNLDKLKIINERIGNEFQKNRLLYYTMIHFVDISKSDHGYDELFNSFKEKCTNEYLKRNVARTVNVYKRLSPGYKIPSVTLLDKNDREVNLTSLINKPTVIYFWAAKSKVQIISSHKRAEQLKIKYPEVDFLAINIDSISYLEQASILNHFGVKNKDREFRFKFPKKSKEVLSIRPISKIFLVDENKRIINPKANMFTISFEQELLGLLNKEDLIVNTLN
ncbi:TlpA family protein disulfide reductase [Pontimicrobium sp. MEBiC01747]